VHVQNCIPHTLKFFRTLTSMLESLLCHSVLFTYHWVKFVMLLCLYCFCFCFCCVICYR